MRVLSGFSDGNASTAALAKRRATAIDIRNKAILLITNSFFSREEERIKFPTHPVTQLRAIIKHLVEASYPSDQGIG
jgi:hypothetical protein